MWRVVVAVLVSGCGVERGVLAVSDEPAPDSDVAVDTAPDSPPDSDACANPLVDVRPGDGAVDVPLDAAVTVTLAAPEEGVGLRVRVEGRDVPGRTEPVPDPPGRYAFVPLQPVRAGVGHTLVVSWSCGVASSGFTTARETWRIETRAGRLEAPAATDELATRLAGLVDPLWIGLDGLFAEREGGGRAEWLLASAEGLSQARCVPTARLGGPLSDGGRAFEATATRATFRAGAAAVPARGVVVSGGVEPATRALDDVRLEAVLDLRPVLARLAGPGASLADLCRSLDAGCLLCDDGQAACARFVWAALPSSRGGPGLVPKDAAAVAADPACAP